MGEAQRALKSAGVPPVQCVRSLFFFALLARPSVGGCRSKFELGIWIGVRLGVGLGARDRFWAQENNSLSCSNIRSTVRDVPLVSGELWMKQTWNMAIEIVTATLTL